MPRKAKPPIRPLVVEDVATGKRLTLETFVDDFTGESVPVVPRATGRDPLALKRDNAKAKAEGQRALLEAVGIMPKPKQAPKPEDVIPKGNRVIGRIGDLVLSVPKPPFRRV